jgi:hypothetical protein
MRDVKRTRPICRQVHCDAHAEMHDQERWTTKAITGSLERTEEGMPVSVYPEEVRVRRRWPSKVSYVLRRRRDGEETQLVRRRPKSAREGLGLRSCASSTW